MKNTGSDQQPALILKGVSKSFGGVHAVVDVSMAVARGERRALIGPNGAGKSTLFNLITGEIARDRGEIVLFGNDLARRPVRSRIRLGMGRTYQTSNLFMNLTVRENIFLSVWKREEASSGLTGLLFKPWSKFAGHCDLADEVAHKVGLEGKLDTVVSELSHGEHRQLELGLTLAHEPRILLLDEPMAGLSANERSFMTDLVMDLEPGITVLIIEHDIRTAFIIAGSVSVLHQGRIIAEGAPEAVREDRNVQEIYTLSREAH